MNGLNGDIAFEAQDVLVGYTSGEPYGYRRNLRVTVSVSMEWLTRQDAYETTEHETVSRPLDFSITTYVWRPDLRDIISGGATVEPLGELDRYADGWTPEKVQALIDLSPWHLNGMTAGCDHVEPVIETDKYGREVPSLDLTPACPETGYRYGHAWLVRVLPDGFLEEVQGIFS